jgi:hypothetical protein
MYTWPGVAPGPVTLGLRPSSVVSAERRACVSAPAWSQQPWDQPVRLVEESEQQMLAVDLGVVQPAGDRLRLLQRFLGLLGEPVHIHDSSLLQPALLRLKADSNSLIRSSRSSTSPSEA